MQRTCAAADRTGHAMLHTLYGQSLRHSTEFFIEYFAIDLIMDDDGALPRRRRAEAWTTARIHRFRAQHDDPGHRRLWPRLFLRHLAPIPAPATATPWCCAPACRCRTWSSCSSTRPASMARAASSPKARAARAAISPTREGERFMERYAPSAKDLASRDVVSRSHDHRNPRRPRRRRGQGPHLPAPRPSRSRRCCTSACPASPRSAQDLRRRRRDARADPGPADRALQHGRHPHELSRRGADRRQDGNPDTRRARA